MSLKIDVLLLSKGDQTNFSTKLIQLYQKGDSHNRYLLGKSFPNMVKVFNQWENAATQDQIEDLPYD